MLKMHSLTQPRKSTRIFKMEGTDALNFTLGFNIFPFCTFTFVFDGTEIVPHMWLKPKI